MWISDSRSGQRQENPADVGTVTLSEQPGGVYLEGERRWNRVFGPGGYRWQPALGEQVLVLKAGAEGEQTCIVGRMQQEELEAGAVEIASGQRRAVVKLSDSGELALSGEVTVNGVGLESLIVDMIEQYMGIGG